VVFNFIQMKKYLIYLLFLYCFFICFWGLNWGTPSWQKSLQIFETKEDILKYLPQMIELRKNFYNKVEKIFIEKKDLKESIQKTYSHNLKSLAFEKLSDTVKLDAMRGYFLGSVNNDEQRNIVAIGNMNPLKFDFNPDDFTYGGLHFYLIAASFLIGKIIGLISLNSDVSYYFFHPDEIKNMYILMRMISAVFTLLTVILLYKMIKFIFLNNIKSETLNVQNSFNYGVIFNCIGCLFLLVSPLIILNSHIAKPHTQGMFWCLLGTYFSFKILRNNDFKNYIFSGIFFGLAVSCLYSNFICIFILFLVEFLKNNFIFKKILNKKFIVANLIFIFVFFITNWYIIFNFNKFLKMKEGLGIIFGYGKFSFNETFSFIKEFFTTNIPAILLFILLFGFIRLFKINKNYFTVISGFLIILFISDLFYFRHPNVFIIGLPFISILLSYGIEYFFITKKLFIKISGLIYSVVVLVFLLVSSILQTGLYCRLNNLTYCGGWINKNIPLKSSIGVINGWFTPGDYPAFRFLDYELIHLPTYIDWEKDKLPEYIISLKNSLEEKYSNYLNNNYKKIFSLKRNENRFISLFFYYEVPTERLDINVYRKTS